MAESLNLIIDIPKLASINQSTIRVHILIETKSSILYLIIDQIKVYFIFLLKKL